MLKNVSYVIIAFGAAFVLVSVLIMFFGIVIDKSLEEKVAKTPKTFYHYKILWTSKLSGERGDVELTSSHQLRDWFMLKEVGKKIEMTSDMFAIISYTESEEIRL